MSSKNNFFAIEARNGNGEWKELSVVHSSHYFENPKKEFKINKEDEEKLNYYRETTKSRAIRLITKDYNKQTDATSNYMVVEFDAWDIIDGKVTSSENTTKEYLLTEEEYVNQKTSKK